MPKSISIYREFDELSGNITSNAEDLEIEINSFDSDCPTDPNDVEEFIKSMRDSIEKMSSKLDYIQKERGYGDNEIDIDIWIDMLSKEYIGSSVGFRDTYGKIDAFKFDKKMIIILIDSKGKVYELDWDDVRKGVFN